MTADQIADSMVDTFNALTGQPFTFVAEKPVVLATVESERSDLGVFVVSKDEQEEAIGDQGDTCRRTRIVSVALNGPIRDGFTLSLYLTQFENLRIALEGTDYSGYKWDKNEVISLWDADALHARNRFLALFEVTYYTFS